MTPVEYGYVAAVALAVDAVIAVAVLWWAVRTR